MCKGIKDPLREIITSVGSGMRGNKRNIWIAEPFEPNGKYTARQITRYTEDDGQEISELSWTPNAESVVYVRGGGA